VGAVSTKGELTCSRPLVGRREECALPLTLALTLTLTLTALTPTLTLTLTLTLTPTPTLSLYPNPGTFLKVGASSA